MKQVNFQKALGTDEFDGEILKNDDIKKQVCAYLL